MTTIADGLKDVFLAGVGAMALGAEKTQELVESLIATALKHDVLEAQRARMTSEQRAEFAKKAAEIAARDSVTKAE